MIFTTLFSSNVFAKEDRDKIRVGYCNDDTIVQKSPKGYFNGYGYDYLMEVSKYTGWEYEFVRGTIDECLEWIKTGKIDLLGPMQYTPERAEYLSYPDYEFDYGDGVLYTRQENKSICYEDFSAFNGMAVGMIKGNHNNLVFKDYAEKNNFAYITKYYDDVQQAIDALELGKVDSIVASSTVDSNELKIIDRFNLAKTYFVTSKQNTEMFTELNGALNQIFKQDIYFALKLSQKYYQRKRSNVVDFTREELDYIEQHSKLRLVGDPDWLPFQIYNESTNKLEGINADLIEFIENYSGLKIDYVYTEDFEEAKSYIEQGRAEMITGEGQQTFLVSLNKTIPYLEVGTALISKNPTLPKVGCKIGVLKDYDQVYTAYDHFPADAEFIEYKNIYKALDGINIGEVDATIINIHLLDYILETKLYGEYNIIQFLERDSEMCLGIADNVDPIVISILDKAIKAITMEDANRAVINNMSGKLYGVTWQSVLKKYSVVIILGFVITILFIMILMLYHRMNTTKQLKRLAYVDDITGENTIEKFKHDSSLLFAKYGAEYYSLVYFDIKRFKYVNDTYGHGIGNELLQHVAKCTKEVLYEFETFARLSADNFVVLLKSQNEKEIQEMLERLERYIQAFEILRKANHNIVLSFGVYFLNKESTDFFDSLDKANIARKSIKGQHSSAIAFYSELMNQKLIEEAEILETMKAALSNGEFHAYIQPKVDLKSEKIIGAEALVRWCHPKKGIIPPDRFIPLFESYGFITKVDFYIFEQVCKLLRRMLESNCNVVPISVNLSRVHMQSSNFVRRLCLIADKYNVPHELLELELTETVTLENMDEITKILHQLKDEGFILAMDDFGTGYSSLNILKSLPFDILKIDRMFFNAERATPREKMIIKDIVRMAHHLKMKVVSEGVETERQAELLKNIYCDMAQGYLYAKPMPIEDFLKHVNT